MHIATLKEILLIPVRLILKMRLSRRVRKCCNMRADHELKARI